MSAEIIHIDVAREQIAEQRRRRTERLKRRLLREISAVVAQANETPLTELPRASEGLWLKGPGGIDDMEIEG
jgi:hypothetical protein